MIAQLRGRLLRKQPQEAVVDVGGVGYRVAIPLSTFYRLGETGCEVTLLTHTHVREDALALFGFLTAVEQALFERLILVSGVGPRLALSVLSGIEAPELVAALQSSDVARLTRIPGVGRKTAERLVVELKDKMKGLLAEETMPAAASPASAQEDLVSALQSSDVARLTRIPGVGKKTAERLVVELKDKVKGLLAADEMPAAASPASAQEDLVAALVHLGYSRAEAERGVERALREGGGEGRFEDLLRRSLHVLSGR